MFNLGKFNFNKNKDNSKSKKEFLSFISSQSGNKKEFLDSIASDYSFVQDDIKLRAMVEDMLKEEFGSKFDNYKEYDFLVDSIVNKLKQEQLGDVEPLE